MKDFTLTEVAKQELIKEYGEKAVIVDDELNQLAKLLVKRKDYIKAFNNGNYKAKERYFELMKESKKIINKINKKI